MSPAILPIVPLETPRGFTGHEHLDGVGLIHMNGRVYDPVLGRYLSADPVVQHPFSTQGLNRYTYVANNPLSYTDPSGFGFFSSLFKGLKKVVKAVVGGIKKALSNQFVRIGLAIAAAVLVPQLVIAGIQAAASAAATAAITASGAIGGPIAITGAAAYAGAVGAAAASSVGASVLAGAAGGFTAGFIASGGDLQAAGIGALTGAAFGFVGGAKVFGGALSGQRILAHGAIGGLRSKLQGGKFATGFLAGAVAKIATPFSNAIGQGNPVAGALASAAVGGTVSELGGGKFANGALTGAYGYLFNAASQARAYRSHTVLRTVVPGQIYFDEAVTAWDQGRYLHSFAFSVGTLADQIAAGLGLKGIQWAAGTGYRYGSGNLERLSTSAYSGLFGRGGFLNSNRYLRIGEGRFEGRRVFRLSGKIIERFKPSGHIDIRDIGPWP